MTANVCCTRLPDSNEYCDGVRKEKPVEFISHTAPPFIVFAVPEPTNPEDERRPSYPTEENLFDSNYDLSAIHFLQRPRDYKSSGHNTSCIKKYDEQLTAIFILFPMVTLHPIMMLGELVRWVLCTSTSACFLVLGAWYLLHCIGYMGSWLVASQCIRCLLTSCQPTTGAATMKG